MTYKCGHPKTPENSWSRGDGTTRCKQCRQAYKAGRPYPRIFVGDGVTTFKACGHPRTPENSWSSGKYPRCKTCHVPRIARWRLTKLVKRPKIRRTRSPNLTSDPAVQLYRAELARRTA